MAVIIGTDSYADEAALSAYAAARGLTIAGDTTQLLLRAMDFIETRSFVGTKATKVQPLQWPRSGVTIDGWSVASDEIPAKLVKAQIEVALSMDASSDPMATEGRAISSTTVGSVSVTYADKSEVSRPKIDMALVGLVRDGIEVVFI
jgi:hypothetical protein